MHSPHLLRSGEKLFQISKGTLAQMQTLVSIYHAHCHEIARVEYYLMEFSLLVLSQVLGFRNSRHESLYTFAQSRVSARRLGTLALSSWTASSTIFSPAPCMTQLISLNWHGGFDCWHIYILQLVFFSAPALYQVIRMERSTQARLSPWMNWQIYSSEMAV